MKNMLILIVIIWAILFRLPNAQERYQIILLSTDLGRVIDSTDNKTTLLFHPIKEFYRAICLKSRDSSGYFLYIVCREPGGGFCDSLIVTDFFYMAGRTAYAKNVKNTSRNSMDKYLTIEKPSYCLDEIKSIVMQNKDYIFEIKHPEGFNAYKGYPLIILGIGVLFLPIDLSTIDESFDDAEAEYKKNGVTLTKHKIISSPAFQFGLNFEIKVSKRLALTSQYGLIFDSDIESFSSLKAGLSIFFFEYQRSWLIPYLNVGGHFLKYDIKRKYWQGLPGGGILESFQIKLTTVGMYGIGGLQFYLSKNLTASVGIGYNYYPEQEYINQTNKHIYKSFLKLSTFSSEIKLNLSF